MPYGLNLILQSHFDPLSVVRSTSLLVYLCNLGDYESIVKKRDRKKILFFLLLIFVLSENFHYVPTYFDLNAYGSKKRCR